RRRRSITVKPDVMFPRNFAQSLIIRHSGLLLLLFCHSERSAESLISGLFQIRHDRSKQSEMFRFAQHDKLQITSRFLFAFDGFEECLEIAFAKTLRPLALNNFEKERRPVFYRLGKYLQQITFIIAIDEN